MPVPYSNFPNNKSTPVMAPSKPDTSATVNTDGMRRGRVGRCTSSSHGNFTVSTSQYKNSKALSAWLWVDRDTLRSVVSMDRNC